MPVVPLGAGSTVDLRQGADGKRWNFTKACDRAAVFRQIRSERPALVIGSPPCTMFSRLNINLNAKKTGSYTNFRAHETGRESVCRVLRYKKKT